MSRPALGPTQNPFNVLSWLSLVIMGLENEDNCLPPPTAQVKNEWIYPLHHWHQGMVLNTVPPVMQMTTNWKG